MPGKLARYFGRALGVLFIGVTLVRALFDAYGQVGAFLGVLPEPVGKFIASSNGTVFLIVFGFVLLFIALRHQPVPPYRLYLRVDWAKLPKRTGGVIGVYDIHASRESGLSWTVHLFAPGVDTETAYERHPAEAMVCELTNHGDVTLANVTLTFGLAFLDSIQSTDMTVIGDTYTHNASNVVHSGVWTVTIPRLMPGTENAAVFYISNRDDVFIDVSVPDSASAELLEDPQRMTIRLPSVGGRRSIRLFNTTTPSV